ncbi:Fc.00g091710.m01.CDS01 [Cosmosporella sp. VM-42]
MALIRLLSHVYALAGVATALNIIVSDAINAGEKVQLTVGFDFWKQPYEYERLGSVWSDVQPVCRNPPASGCSYDSLWEHYRLYLYTPDFMFMCYLTDILDVGEPDPAILIPKDLGPPLDSYQIAVIEFNGTQVYMTEYGLANSSTFSLTSTSISSWSEWEQIDGWVKPYSTLPCSSYGCFRKCGVKYSDDDGLLIRSFAEDMFACFNECPGVIADPSEGNWNWLAHGQKISGSASGSISQPIPTAYSPPTTKYGEAPSLTNEPIASHTASAARTGSTISTAATTRVHNFSKIVRYSVISSCLYLCITALL